MTSNNNNWIADTVGDFIHSPIWAAPIHTFIEANCAAFDYDDDDLIEEENASSLATSVEEQLNIHEKYQRLVNALIDSLGYDLSLDENELKKVCQLPTAGDDSVSIDESYEQLYAAKDFQLFQEMMRRKNLILQLQALVSLQLQWGLLKHSDTGDDLVLSLLLQATSSPRRRDSINPPSEPIEQSVEKHPLPVKEDKHHQDVDDDDDDDDVVVVQQKQPPPPPPASSYKTKERQEPRKPPKEEYHLPGLRRRGGGDLDAEWYRKLQQDSPKRDDDDDSTEDDQSKKTSTPQTIGAIPEEVLREKLRELTVRTASSVDDETAAAITSRKNFLKKQRELIVEKQRAERARDLEQQTQEQEQQQTRHARPQSAAHVARKAIATASKTNENKQEEEQKQTQIPDAELIRRRAMAAKLKREVVDKR